MHKRLTAVTVTCLSLLLAGCGGGSDDETAAQPAVSQSAAAESSAAPTAAASAESGISPSANAGADSTGSPSTEVRLGKAEAKRLAAAGILREADLPGYAAEAQAKDPTYDEVEAKMNECVGEKKTVYVARDFGTTFTKSDLEITSSADVVVSEAAAKREVRAYGGAKGARCMTEMFTDLFANTGVEISALEVDPVKTTVKGAGETFGFRLLITLSGPGGSVDMNALMVGAVVGPVEISVSSFETGSATFTLKKVEALAAIAAKRVKSAL